MFSRGLQQQLEAERERRIRAETALDAARARIDELTDRALTLLEPRNVPTPAWAAMDEDPIPAEVMVEINAIAPRESDPVLHRQLCEFATLKLQVKDASVTDVAELIRDGETGSWDEEPEDSEETE